MCNRVKYGTVFEKRGPRYTQEYGLVRNSKEKLLYGLMAYENLVHESRNVIHTPCIFAPFSKKLAFSNPV